MSQIRSSIKRFIFGVQEAVRKDGRISGNRVVSDLKSNCFKIELLKVLGRVCFVWGVGGLFFLEFERGNSQWIKLVLDGMFLILNYQVNIKKRW